MNNKIICLIIIIIMMIFLSGCTENIVNSNNEKFNDFIGEWIGKMDYNMFNFNNTTITSQITKLKFSESEINMTILNDNGTTINLLFDYSYDDNQILYKMKFQNMHPQNNDFDFNNSNFPPFEGDHPPFDNQSIPPHNDFNNDSFPPHNETGFPDNRNMSDPNMMDSGGVIQLQF